MDMQKGKILHLPVAGSGVDQPEWLISAMKYSWRVWYINEYKLSNGLVITEKDNSFMEWVLS